MIFNKMFWKKNLATFAFSVFAIMILFGSLIVAIVVCGGLQICNLLICKGIDAKNESKMRRRKKLLEKQITI